MVRRSLAYVGTAAMQVNLMRLLLVLALGLALAGRQTAAADSAAASRLASLQSYA